MLGRNVSSSPKPFYKDSFRTYTSAEWHKLTVLYEQLSGRIPPKRLLREHSRQLHIPQTRIKRWFEARQHEGDDIAKIANKNVSEDEESSNLEILNTLEIQMTQLEAKMTMMEQILNGIYAKINQFVE